MTSQPIQSPYPIIGLCAYSGTGKTTLMTELIPLLKAQGLKLAIIKHAHHKIDLDSPGKDTYRMREAGADQVILASHKFSAVMIECELSYPEASLQQALGFINPECVDLVLVEGFKHESFPKIELHRPSLGKPLMFLSDANIVAVATDAPLPEGLKPPAVLELNQPQSIADFIIKTVLPHKPNPTTEIKLAPSCADASEPSTLSLAQARLEIETLIPHALTRIKRSLREALGFVLAQDVVSPVNVPAHTNSAMDGYAIRGADLNAQAITSFKLVGSAFAGNSFQGECDTGQCVRIMTGAPMPHGTDTVIMQEHADAQGDTVRIGTGHKVGQNVRYAGEDIAANQLVLRVGQRLRPADLGLLASLGINEVMVYRRPRVAFFSTGDELRSIGETLDEGCVYDSNRYTLFGMLTELGMETLDMGVVRDNPEALEAAFLEASQQADVVITSGGVSVGEADFTKQVLDKLGKINFWKIAIKPGRPLAYGTIGKALFFGLPGNPVAVMVTFQQLVQPALLKLSGQSDFTTLQIPALLQDPIRKKPGRTEFIRGIMALNAKGELVVSKTGAQGSGILTSMSSANCYIVLPPLCGNVEAGAQVMIEPLRLQL